MKYTLLAATVMAVIAPKVQGTTPYTLEELGNLSNAKHSYVTASNESGQAVGVATIPYDITVDTSALDFQDDNDLIKSYNDLKDYLVRIEEEITFTLEDIENGTINGDAQQFLQDFLKARVSDSEYQKISQGTSFEFNLAVDYNNTPGEVLIFDIEDADYNGLTRSVENVFTGISEDAVKVGWGSAPYSKISFTNNDEEETHYIRDFTRRGFIITNTGERIDLNPTDSEYGGISVATDILKVSDGYLITGETSVSIASDPQELIDDNCDGDDRPVEVCYESYVTSSNNALYNRHATVWRLDNDFNIIDVVDLGLGITPDAEEAEKARRSVALSVNQNEVAVGYSNVRYRDRDFITSYPVYFENGNVVEFIDEEEYEPGGAANAINSENVITGYSVKRINNGNRNKFFYHDISTGETVFPTDYFNSSASIANDINDSGWIVGQGEVETSSNFRRSEGFLYKIDDNTFTNINSLLPCFSSDGDDYFPYVLGQANVINNDGTIYGAATKTVDKRDAQGNVVVDSDGNVEQESIVVPVKLTLNPNGVAADCVEPEQETYERQGASTSFLWLLLPLFALRRRFSK
jgi:hypothetical protein